jgi:hypothetical protein
MHGLSQRAAIGWRLPIVQDCSRCSFRLMVVIKCCAFTTCTATTAHTTQAIFSAKRKLHGDFCIEQRYGGDQMLCIHDMYSHHSMFISNNCGK